MGYWFTYDGVVARFFAVLQPVETVAFAVQVVVEHFCIRFVEGGVVVCVSRVDGEVVVF